MEQFIEYGDFQLPQAYSEPFGLPSPDSGPYFCRAVVEDGAQRPNNAYFDRRRRPRTEVTIKRITADNVGSDKEAKQMYREVVILKQIEHENVARLLDIFISPIGDLYVVVENEDCDLARILTPHFQWEQGHVAYILYTMLRGLKYLHSAGIIHRDLRPDNILLDQSLSCRIANFSRSRPTDPGGLKTAYVTTRFYRAPEVLMTWQSYSKALDVWGVGCIFAEMINRLRECITLTVDQPDGSKLPYYCIFPANSHIEHLGKVFRVLGPPDSSVMAKIHDKYVIEFVNKTVAELQGQMTTLRDYFAGQPEPVLSLLESMLCFDSHRRATAAQALEHGYLSLYHDPADEPVRSPIQRQFESKTLSASEWRAMIDMEIADMQVIHGLASNDAVEQDTAETTPLADINLMPFDTTEDAGPLDMTDFDADLSQLPDWPADDISDLEQLKAQQSALVAQLDRTRSKEERDQISQQLAEVGFNINLATGQYNMDALLSSVMGDP
eukprot:TRINITY_DN8679_c0_g1_i2.p1 TRINITY_DN8679_c0_g1~~TRINITY_DN8679_c0_g1_i2.p1  ORF type:complete len:497 (+),score=77.18 TRINITY_DN8679_c0_g1_i2:44-1534(+)